MALQVLRNQIRNQRGDALIIAMVIIVISLISSMAIINYARQAQSNSRNPRVKSIMTAVEAKVRNTLLRPSSYNGCVGGRGTCTLDHSKLTALSRPVPGAQCPPQTPNCGVSVSVTSFVVTANPSTGQTVSRATVVIHYEGLEASLKDIAVIMDVPADILQSTGADGIFQCPVNAPQFIGFNSDGTLNCHGFALERAQPGQFLSSVDLTTLSLTHANLPTNKSCPATQYISHVDWTLGGTAVNITCSPRVEPYGTFGYTPAPTYTPNPDY